MNHRKLNGLITGVAMVFLGVIIAAIFYGPDSSSDSNDLTPGFVDTATEQETPHEGVGGQPAETPEVTDEQWTQVGTVTDAETGEPLAGVSVMANEGGIVDVSTETRDDGWFELQDVPSSATLVFSLDGYRTTDRRVAADQEHNVSLESRVISGRVVGSTGSPIVGAIVASGGSYTRTVENGIFRLEDVPSGADVIVKASGFETMVTPREEHDQGFILEPKSIRAVYASASTIADADRFAELLDMVERTGLNAVVLDIKDSSGRIHYGSQVPLAQETGAVQGTFDAGQIIEQLNDRGIYSIARLTVFEDPLLAEARPDLAIHDSLSGGLWQTWQGHAWVNPYLTEVRDYNIDLIQEAAELGFNEIQLSSVQFPERGPISRADYGQTNVAQTRQQAVNDFLDHASAKISPTATSLSSDIFAMALWDETNDQTGQSLISMTERVDYIHPLLFPSHFDEGSLGLELPGDHPSAIVGRSIESGRDLLPAQYVRRIRPWLQDFSYGPRMQYGEHEVREQIEAAERFGVSGWMLWNPGSSYHDGALEAEE